MTLRRGRRTCRTRRRLFPPAGRPSAPAASARDRGWESACLPHAYASLSPAGQGRSAGRGCAA
eukprot:760482-Hanusia_phi.AAC.11